MRIKEYFQQNQRFSEFINQLADNPNIQGAILQLDPVWLGLWALHSRYGQKWLDQKLNTASYPFRYYPLSFDRWILDMTDIYIELGHIYSLTFNINDFRQLVVKITDHYHKDDYQIQAPFRWKYRKKLLRPILQLL